MNPFVDDLTQQVESIRSNGRPAYAAPIHWVMLTNGDAEYQDSIVLFGFETGRAGPSMVVKTPRLPRNGWVLRVEYERLVELWELLGEKSASCLPKPVDLITIRGQTALILSYVRGENLVRASKKSLWDNPAAVQGLAVDAAHAYREILDSTSTSLLPGEQVPSDFQEKVEKFRQYYSLTSKENVILSDLVDMARANQAGATRKVLVQGDFWHGNIIRAVDGGSLMFIDWQYSRWATDVSLDVYLFLLAGAQAAVTNRATMEQRLAGIMGILQTWRAGVIPAYLTAFGKPEGCSLLPIRSGMLAACLEMAVRIKMDFGIHHIDDILWRQIFAELTSWPEEI